MIIKARVVAHKGEPYKKPVKKSVMLLELLITSAPDCLASLQGETLTVSVRTNWVSSNLSFHSGVRMYRIEGNVRLLSDSRPITATFKIDESLGPLGEAEIILYDPINPGE